jgi:hypothetical protein
MTAATLQATKKDNQPPIEMHVLRNPHQPDSSKKTDDVAARTAAFGLSIAPSVSPKVLSSDITKRMSNFLKYATKISESLFKIFLSLVITFTFLLAVAI